MLNLCYKCLQPNRHHVLRTAALPTDYEILNQTGMSMLSEINEHLPLFNMAGISFAMLFSVEAANRRFDYVRIPTDNAKGRRKIWMMKLFRKSPVGVCWIQVDLIEGMSLTAHHVVFLEIVKEWKICILPDNHIATMQDIIEETCTTQKRDVDEANRMHTGKRIFATFLDATAMRLEPILLVKYRAHNNYSCTLASSA